jgi:GntR family colanic acid and biofilm gene transcriptional regulator
MARVKTGPADRPGEATVNDESYLREEVPEAHTLVPVSRETLHEKIYHQIREQLITGRFVPGQQLTLRSLARVLGTSLIPVRDALQRLESLGVLETQANRTMIVPRLSQEKLTEIREVRESLEGLAAERAARYAEPADIQKLETYVKMLEEAANAGDSIGFLRANWLFHTGVAEASKSSIIAAMTEPLWLRMGPTIRLSKPNRDRMIEALPCHRAALEAITAGDAAAARRAVAADITGCFDIFKEARGVSKDVRQTAR